MPLSFIVTALHNGPAFDFGGAVQVGPIRYSHRFSGTGLYAINGRGETLALAFDVSDMEPQRPRWIEIGG